MLHGLAPGILGGDLRRIRGRFARTLEPLAARGRPRDRVALGSGDRDHRVVEGCRDMRGARSDVLALASPQTRCCRFRHLALSAVALKAPYFFLPAIGRAGPLRARALVCVLWPRTGSPLRWRRPRQAPRSISRLTFIATVRPRPPSTMHSRSRSARTRRTSAPLTSWTPRSGGP